MSKVLTEEQREKRREYKRWYMKLYRAEHPEYVKSVRERSKKFRIEHPDQCRARVISFQRDHKEELKTYRREYGRQWRSIESNSETQRLRTQSSRLLKSLGIHRPGYEVHHYTGQVDNMNFVYIPASVHKLLHSMLGKENKSVPLEEVFKASDLMPEWYIVQNGQIVYSSKQEE